MTGESAFLKELLFGICCQLNEIAKIVAETRRDTKHPADTPIPTATMGNFQHMREQLAQLLTSVTKYGAGVFIFIDNISDINPTKESNITNWLPSPLPKNVKTIISLTVAKTPFTLEREQDGSERFVSTLLKGCSIVYVTKSHLQDGRNGIHKQFDNSNPAALFQSFSQKSNRTLTVSQMCILLEHVNFSTSCLQLETLFHTAAIWTSFTSAKTSVKCLENWCPETMVQTLLSVLEQNHEKTFYRSVLCFLSLARNGLTQREIIDLVARDNKYIGNQALSNGTMHSYNLNLLNPNKRTMRRPALKPTLSAAPERCAMVFEINAYWYRLVQDIGNMLMPCYTDGTVTLKWKHRTFSESVKDK